MESEFFYVQSFHDSWFCITFLATITIVMSIIFFILHSVRIRVRYCTCEICQTYIQSSWITRFPNLCDWYTHLLKQSPNRTIHFHVLNNTITANPDNVEYMLKTKFENFPKGKSFSTILGDFLGRGIFNVDGDSWKFQRKLASLELGRVTIRAYAFEVVSQEINLRLIPLLDSVPGQGETNTIDLQDVFRRFSFDFICRFSFGLDPKCLELSRPMSEFAVSFDLASKLSAERAMAAAPLIWKIKRFLNVGSERELRRSVRAVHILADEVIKKRRKFGFQDQKDLLSRFMCSISDDIYLRDIVVSFLLAGRDTVASALTSFFWLVVRHREVEAAILDEAEKIIGTENVVASCDQMRELHYLHAAIYESMRLCPPIQFDSKFCLEDDFLPDGSFVKKGTRVTYHPYAMGRMEEIWGRDCLEFRPERWIRDGIFRHESPFNYPVFQGGLRVCLGKEMALVEIKSVAIALLRRYRVKLADESGKRIPRFLPGLTATYRDGLQVSFRHRNCDGVM